MAKVVKPGYNEKNPTLKIKHMFYFVIKLTCHSGIYGGAHE
jgi:hypothetical protein